MRRMMKELKDICRHLMPFYKIVIYSIGGEYLMNTNQKLPTEYIDINNGNLWDFQVLDGVHFQNANRIHPLKQREWKKLRNS